MGLCKWLCKKRIHNAYREGRKDSKYRLESILQRIDQGKTTMARQLVKIWLDEVLKKIGKGR